MSKHLKIKMLETAKGADEHIHVRTYLEGQEYLVSKCLAESFVGSKVAEFVGSHKEKPSHDNKALSSSDYQNKSDKSRKGDK